MLVFLVPLLAYDLIECWSERDLVDWDYESQLIGTVRSPRGLAKTSWWLRFSAGIDPRLSVFRERELLEPLLWRKRLLVRDESKLGLRNSLLCMTRNLCCKLLLIC